MHHIKKSKVYSAWRTANSAVFGTVWKRVKKEREKEGKSLIPVCDTA